MRRPPSHLLGFHLCFGQTVKDAFNPLQRNLVFFIILLFYLSTSTKCGIQLKEQICLPWLMQETSFMWPLFQCLTPMCPHALIAFSQNFTSNIKLLIAFFFFFQSTKIWIIIAWRTFQQVFIRLNTAHQTALLNANTQMFVLLLWFF